MRFHFFALCVAAVLVAALGVAGCGDSIVIVEQGPGDVGIVSTEISPGDTEFEIVARVAGSANDPVYGPFVIRGSNIHYDAGIGALMVDLTVTNNSQKTYPLPVRLEFVTLMPAGVKVLNPSNGVFGPGAMIQFAFADRDVHWTPGETSLPRNVQFEVEEGVSIAFSARLHVGPLPELGAIGGVVWADYNEDGKRDPFEPGLAGREVLLAHTDSLFDCITPWVDCPDVRRTTTANDGSYRFDELRAGHYTVMLVRDRCSTPTTPTEIEVILVEIEGGVGSFLDANFGVLPLLGCCGVLNGDFSDGENYWSNEDEGPGLEWGVEEIVDVDGRVDVLHLDSRADSDYYLVRAQMIPSCGILGHVLQWTWKIADLEAVNGMAEVMITFYDGADAPMGSYFVRRHTGDLATYSCDHLIQQYTQTHPSMIVGCEEITATAIDWLTTAVLFNEDFFAGLAGPDINPNTIAMLKIWVESKNNDGEGADAYFDDFYYGPPKR